MGGGISIRRILDGLYRACGALAALFLLSILVFVSINVVSRLTPGWTFIGADAYAGYALAAASFFGFAYALAHDEHIAVVVLLDRLRGRPRFAVELARHLVALGLSVWIAWHAGQMVWWSWSFHDVSQEIDATPLWIPQLGMALGAAALAVGFLDRTARLILRRGEAS